MTGSNTITGADPLLGKKRHWSSVMISLICLIMPLFSFCFSMNLLRVFSKSNSLLLVCSSVYVWNFKLCERREVSIFLISLCVGIFFRNWEPIKSQKLQTLTYTRHKRLKHLCWCVLVSMLFPDYFLLLRKRSRKRLWWSFEEYRRRDVISSMLN